MRDAALKSCILHIGTEKTGTTTLQDFLGLNRERLLAKGFFVPTSLHGFPGADHRFLTTCSLDIAEFTDEQRVALQIRRREDVINYRHTILNALSQEIQQAAAGRRDTTLILSNELCHSRLTKVGDILFLRDFLKNFVEDFTVVVYIRPQHEVALSLYDTALKVGYSDIDVPPTFAPRRPIWVQRSYFDYAELLEKWGAVFGKERIIVRIFERAELVGGSVIDDFLSLIGCHSDEFIIPDDKNISLDVSCQTFLNLINRYRQRYPSLMSENMRRSIVYTLSNVSSGTGWKPRRSKMINFFHSFVESNEKVRLLFFEDREQIFRPDFSYFPEKDLRQIAWSFPPVAILRLAVRYLLYKTGRCLTHRHGAKPVGER